MSIIVFIVGPPMRLLPYYQGITTRIRKALFLLRFGDGRRGGRIAMYRYRLFLAIHCFFLVSTTLLKATNLPEDLTAHQHHIRPESNKATVATTVGKNVFLQSK